MFSGWQTNLWLRVKALIARRRLDRDLEDEIAFHLAMRERKHRNMGLGQEQARYAARREFGNPTSFKESSRRMWTFAGAESILQDLFYAARALRKTPGFTAVVVLSLALGIGANSTIFSVLNAVLYRPLPYSQPDKLMMIWETAKGGHRVEPPVAEVVDWKKQNHVFEDIAQTSGVEPMPLAGLGEPEQINEESVTPNFFDVLRVKPALGRIFLTNEIQDATQTVVISDAFWERRFHRDPGVLGKSFTVAGVLSTVVGVMPRGFAPFYGEKIDLWYPINPAGDRYSKRDDRGWLSAIGRLKPNVTRARAQTEMDWIARRLAQQYPEINKGIGEEVQPLHDALFGPMGQYLYPLAGAVAFVLLIGCVNVANLLLSRSETRRKEYALRASLGAGRSRLMQQMLIEGGLVALIGGALGIGLTIGGIRLFRALAADFPNAGSISVDGRVLLFTLVASLVTAILSGSVPSIFASRPDLNAGLREGESRTAAGSRGRARHAFAIAEVALAMVLLLGAGLMIDTVLHLKQVNPGFDPRNVLTAGIFVPEGGKYVERLPGGSMERTSAIVTPFFERVVEKIAALPGVESAGIISHVLGADGRTFSIMGHAVLPANEWPSVGYNEVSPSLFWTLRIPLKAGRYLDLHDNAGAPWVAVINEAFARRYFPKENPIGQRILLRYRGYRVNEPQPRQIVGVVGDVKQNGLQAAPPELIYASYLQQPAAFPGGCITDHIDQTLVLRTALNVRGMGSELASVIKKTVQEVNPDVPVADIESMDRVLAMSIEDPQFYMRLLGVFAAMAVLLAMIGIYGVMSYFVQERTREIGVRIALGAQRRDVLGLIAKLGLKLVASGIIIGIALGFGLTRLIAAFLYGVSARDPIVFAGVGLALALTAMLASYLPANRAVKVDPAVILRYE
jgi:putative ABC transport system permease protein